MEIENTYIEVRTRGELMVAAKFYAMRGLSWNDGRHLISSEYTEKSVNLPTIIKKKVKQDGVTWGRWHNEDLKQIPIKQAALSLFYESLKHLY